MAASLATRARGSGSVSYFRITPMTTPWIWVLRLDESAAWSRWRLQADLPGSAIRFFSVIRPGAARSPSRRCRPFSDLRPRRSRRQSLVDHRSPRTRRRGVALAGEVLGDGDGLARSDGLNRRAGGNGPDNRKLDGADARPRGLAYLDRAASIQARLMKPLSCSSQRVL